MTISPGIKVQYVAIVDTKTLQEINTITDKALVAVAVTVGDTRLIDNILIDLNNL